jgi:biotin transporter BioY
LSRAAGQALPSLFKNAKNVSQGRGQMELQKAFIPSLLIRRGNLVSENILSVAVGVTLVSLLAQVAVPLAWTPVPITGQTFGVALTALLWGRKRALAIMLSYFSLGAAGLPLFAMAKSGLSFGPTLGYLIGMIFAAYWMGSLADRGWTKTYFRTWLAALSGSAITFIFGLAVLSSFVPSENLLIAGLFPFLPGDLIKTFLVSTIAWSLSPKK